jgi:hypothetical protein
MDVDAGTKISVAMARREAMLEPDEVSVMLRLNKLGWGTRRIAVELGCSRTTVKRHICMVVVAHFSIFLLLKDWECQSSGPKSHKSAFCY